MSRQISRRLTRGSGSVTFADVAGIDTAKREVQECVDFLKNPAVFQLSSMQGPTVGGCVDRTGMTTLSVATPFRRYVAVDAAL